MTNIELYLKKLQNDIDEKLYDLLVEHLRSVHKIIPKIEENKGHLNTLYEILNQAIENTIKKTNRYTQKIYPRITIKLINKYLTYDPTNQNIKDKKLQVLNEFTCGDYELNEKIPLRSQLTELRITYDTNYLVFLIEKRLIPNKEYSKALYCLIALELVEPDYEKLEQYKSEIFNNLKPNELNPTESFKPENKTIVLDTNIILAKLLVNIGDYSFFHSDINDYAGQIALLGNNNKFILTPTVVKELQSNLEVTKEQIWQTCKRDRRFNGKEICETLEKRFDNIISKYKTKHEFTKMQEYIEKIKEFYSKFPIELYQITLDKLEHNKISHKLKKLAQRESLLPELGDITLLAESLELNEELENICILSNDKDLFRFNSKIKEEFGVDVFK